MSSFDYIFPVAEGGATNETITRRPKTAAWSDDNIALGEHLGENLP